MVESKRNTAVLLSAALCGPAVVACQPAPPAQAAPKAAAGARGEGLPKVQVATAAVESGDLSRTLEITGTLLAEDTSNVAIVVPGTVAETPVDVGDVVKKGDALVRLDDRDARLRLAAAVASLMQVRARLGLPMEESKDGEKVNVVPDSVPEVKLALASHEAARADLERTRRLYEEKTVSTAQYDLARLKLEQAAAQVEAARNGVAQSVAGLAAAEAQVAMARKAVADMTVRAPFHGAVARRNVAVGEFASAQTPVVQLVRSEVLRLALDVPETAVGALSIGLDVELHAQGRPDALHGKVARIAPAVDGQSRSLRVEARVENADGRLKPGMFVSARVVLPTRELALWVPRDAVVTTSGTSRVFLVNGNHVEERIVVVGEHREELVEVRGALKVGDRVVVKNVDKLVDGAPVEG